jgi:ketosteroid isomerase-like protein
MSPTTMTAADIAAALIDLCKQGKNYEAMTTLYAKDIVSIEAGGPPGASREVHGIDAAMAKGQWWADNHEVHSAEVTGPWPNGDQFIVRFKYDVTFKPENRRLMLDEMALYTVKDGKIVQESFFYGM